ncbi:carboxylesterase/lipase family protein [Acidipila sp. EB88]|uniref:carboxylesterase/lipase family protein n=1 Tax=Acidipila sp. EB88 TaxID=2305226 RepID=UPI0013154DAE|nr:carboxylesterase family protein [Acidipila sp. EB88]
MHTSRRNFLISTAAAAVPAAAKALPLGSHAAALLAQSSFATSFPSVVSTPSGKLRGTLQDGVRVFRGVPYAAPPVGPLRFRPTSPVVPWPGIRDANSAAPTALQTHPQGPTSEDCLYLNLWTPEGPGPFPVLVWIHGGGFTAGSASDPMADGARFARDGIVCITVAYRLGVFGFLDVEPLLGPSYAGSANNALHDLITALRWTQTHVASFGGDPARVTVGGQSAGAKLTDILLGVPAAQLLFQSAISESGGAERVWSTQQARTVGEGFSKQWRGQSGNTVDALRAAPADLLQAQERFMAIWPRHFPLRPQIDGDLLTRLPLENVATGSTRGRRLLIGTNLDESAFFLGPTPGAQPTRSDLGNLSLEAFDPILARYAAIYPKLSVSDRCIRAVTAEEYWIPSLRVAEAAAGAGCATWMYRFDYSENAGRLRGYAFHSLELRFVWQAPGHSKGAAEAALATQMHTAWVTFIKGDAPAATGLPSWPRYDAQARSTLILDRESRVEQQPHAGEMLLWSGSL